jgi:hypothetical protein
MANNSEAQKQQVAARGIPIGLSVGMAITAAVITANSTHPVKAAETSAVIGTRNFVERFWFVKGMYRETANA